MRSTVVILAALLVPALLHAADQSATQKKRVTDDLAMEKPVESEFPTVVLPEATTTIRLSSSDLNRISCPAEIREALTSTEKGVTIKITGKDAFVKFKVTKKGDKLSYASTPTELYVVCGEETFSMIAFPQRIPSQTIRLTSGRERKIKDNLSLYAGLPFEKKLLRAIRDIYTENIPDSYTVVRKDKRYLMFREIALTLKRTVDIEGEGLRIKEYEATLRGETSEFRMNEKMFLRTELAENPVAVALERHILRQGDTSRIFVVEQRAEKQEGRKLAGDLPVMDSSGASQKIKQETAQKQQPAPADQEAEDEK
ncbi:type-F conjugative transfer system secretin TraK [Geobacter sulfurreducens]|uniref:type-F conjugative transfer system secretin TraK n=1 Tax=Geobacter sulfurreducens TaxID=35554 RepID=UPI002BD29916|nr:type-F conjugative transfer system secretin TraK [Geobacter sulfurreducens]HML78970.1 type-F conjugative transfer system secretin TraK [Geobacter sulfurreducens]